MGLRQSVVGIGLVILFGISLVTFMLTFINQNAPSQDLSDDPLINSTLGSLQDRAANLEDLGQSSKELIESAEPSATYVFLIFKAAFDIPYSFLTFLFSSVITIITVIWLSIFGVGNSSFNIVFGAITAILLITIVLLIMRAIRIGETER